MAAYEMFGKMQIDASDALHDFSCAPCSDDGKNTEALFQCTDCQVFYCQICVMGHNKFTKNHHVVEKSSDLFGQGRRQPGSVSSSELPTDLCEEHHGEVIKISCEGVEYIPNVAKELLKGRDKDKTKASLEKVKDDLQNLKSKMQNELKGLNQQRDGLYVHIRLFKEMLIEMIEKLEKKSIKEVQHKHREIADDITASSKKIDKLLGDVERQLDKLKHSKGDNEAQLFVDITYGEKKLSDGNECVMDSNVRKEKTLEFEENRRIENLLDELKSLGRVTVRTARTAEDFFCNILRPDPASVNSRGKNHSRNVSGMVQMRYKYNCDQCGKATNDNNYFAFHKARGCAPRK